MLSYLKMSLKSNATLKVDFAGFMFVTLLIFGFRYTYFGVFFQEVDNLGGWEEKYIYLLFTLSIIMTLLSNSFTYSIHKYFDDVHKGKIEAYLVKPTPQYQVLLFRGVNVSNLLLFFMLGISWIIYLYMQGHLNGISAWYFTSCVGLFFIGVLVNISFVVSFESLTFITARNMPIDYIHSELNRLTQVPASLFDIKTMGTLLALLPMVFSCSVIIQFIRDGFGFPVQLYLCFALIQIVGSALIFRKLQQSFDSHGG